MTQNNEVIFELNGVCYSYVSKNPALNDVSLKIRSGDSVAFLGANGSGKSTLIKMMDGLIYPTSGIIRAFGTVLSEAALELNRSEFARYFRRRIGLVFQDADSQLFSPIVWEEVAFTPLQLGLTQVETMKRVDETLSLLGINHLRDRSPLSLSEGEKRKVAIASVLSGGPDVLLLDEPSSDLDPRSRVWLADFLVELHKVGRTIVMATHDLELAAEISDRCIILDEQHRIMGDGLTEEILADRDLLLHGNLIHERQQIMRIHKPYT